SFVSRGGGSLVVLWGAGGWGGAGRPNPASTGEMGGALWYAVGPDYLRALRVPLLAGRFFGPGDTFGAQPVVVVDEVLARQQFGSEDPVGKWIPLGDDSRPVQRAQIVGIVGHVKQQGLASAESPPVRAQPHCAVTEPADARV